MKKLLVALCLTCVLALAVQAGDDKPGKKKHELTAEQKAEQKALHKEMLAKYDTNKDGKLDKAERAKISKEDQEKLEKAGLGGRHKKADSSDKKDASK